MKMKVFSACSNVNEMQIDLETPIVKTLLVPNTKKKFRCLLQKCDDFHTIYYTHSRSPLRVILSK